MAKKKVKTKVKVKVRANAAAKKVSPRVAPASNPTWEVIYAAVERIPRGRVSTYGTIAQVAGLPRRARLVGTALKSLPASRRLAWHRVITSSGRLAFPDGSDAHGRQTTRLAKEGVRMVRGRVDLERYGWPQENKSLDELLWGSA